MCWPTPSVTWTEYAGMSWYQWRPLKYLLTKMTMLLKRQDKFMSNFTQLRSLHWNLLKKIWGRECAKHLYKLRTEYSLQRRLSKYFIRSFDYDDLNCLFWNNMQQTNKYVWKKRPYCDYFLTLLDLVLTENTIFSVAFKQRIVFEFIIRQNTLRLHWSTIKTYFLISGVLAIFR